MPPIQPRIKLAIADDHRLFRKGIISLIELKGNDRYLIVLEAENGDELLRKLDRKALPDIIIMDIEMPKTDGFQAVSWLREHYPEIKILVVSQTEKEESIIRMLRLGVKGYLSKDIDPDELHAALQAIHRHGFYYTDYITGKLIHNLNHEEKKEEEHEPSNLNKDLWAKITEKEITFLNWCCSELTYEQIAGKMMMSPKTIDGYRTKLFEKYNASTRVGLVLFAIRNGLVKV
jgi:two-component system, NarL family, invasion response regulator UvrY